MRFLWKSAFLMLVAVCCFGMTFYGRYTAATLRAGAATRVVNPSKPSAPSGHMSRTLVPPEQIYSDICTQALVIEDAAGKRAVLITSDFMMIPAEVCDRLRSEIRRKYGIPPDAVCVHAIHNHASPPLAESEAVAAEFFDPQYGKFFEAQTVEAVGDALARLQPVQLRFTEDVCTSVAISRRGFDPQTGLPANQPNTKGPVDFKVRVVAAEDAGGNASIILVEYAAHPVVTTNTYLGGEYPSFVRKWLGKKLPGATVMFFQGCSGNVRIQVLDESRTGWIQGTPAMAESFGHDLADAAERALDKPGSAIQGPVEYRYAVVDVPLQSSAGPLAHKFRIQAFRFGGDSESPFIWVALGAEAFIEYEFNIEELLAPARTVVIGYANDLAGYLPTAQAIHEGGYEPAAWNEVWYGLEGPYAPAAEQTVLGAVRRLLSKAQ